jgi:hypothetical protein
MLLEDLKLSTATLIIAQKHHRSRGHKSSSAPTRSVPRLSELVQTPLRPRIRNAFWTSGAVLPSMGKRESPVKCELR